MASAALVRVLGSAALALPFVIGTAIGADADRGGVESFRFAATDINESSGLVVLHDGRVVTTNDSGDSARIFVVDPADGETDEVIAWDGEVTDVEALAPAGEDAVWVADIGDNRRTRDEVTVTRVGLRGRAPTTFTLRYRDGAHDAETLLQHPLTGRLMVVTKGVFSGEVHEAPLPLRSGRVNRLRSIASTGGIVTDGAFLPGGGAVVLRDYGKAWVVSAQTWETVASWELPAQDQGEGLAVDATGGVPRLLISSEGLNAPVLSEPLPPQALVADWLGSPVWQAVALAPWVPPLG